MRHVGEITNTHQYKIDLYTWNNKYIVKIEAGQCEQIYKINQLDFLGTEDDIQALCQNQDFINAIVATFHKMHQDWQSVLTNADLL